MYYPMSNKMPGVEAILAVDLSYGLAKNGVIPWKSKTDLKFFKNKTIGGTVIMGSKTLLSLPNSQPLKGRRNIVITNEIDKYSGFYRESEVTFVDINYALNLIKNNKDEMIYVIGGNQIFNLLLPYCSKIWITRIKKNYDCDLIFDFNLLSELSEKEVIYQDDELEIMCLL